MECPHEKLYADLDTGWLLCDCGLVCPFLQVKREIKLVGRDDGIVLPQLYSKVLEDEIVDAVAAGAHPRTAARVCGLTREEFKRWMADDRIPFKRRVDQAHQGARQAVEQQLLSEKPERWAEIMFPEEDDGAPGFARATKVQVSGRVEHAHAHVHELGEMTIDELRARRAELLAIEATTNAPDPSAD